MTTARAAKAGERLVKLIDAGDLTPNYLAGIVEEATGLKELETDYANMATRLLTAMDDKAKMVMAIKDLLADGSNGAARDLARLVLSDLGEE